MSEKSNKDKVEEQTQAFCNMLKKSLADLFKQKRKEQKITIRNLYDLSGVSTTVISDIENQVYLPRIDVIMRIVYALNISMDELFNNISTIFEVQSSNKSIYGIDIMLTAIGLKQDAVNEILNYIHFKELQQKNLLPQNKDLQTKHIMKNLMQ